MPIAYISQVNLPTHIRIHQGQRQKTILRGFENRRFSIDFGVFLCILGFYNTNAFYGGSNPKTPKCAHVVYIHADT